MSRWLSWISIALVIVACGRRTPREDLGAIDLAAASTRIRALVVDCTGFAHTLDVLATSRLPARSLIGLVDEAVELGRAKCRDATSVIGSSSVAHRLARARLADRPEDALVALGHARPDDAVALLLLRSELLERLGRPAEALVQLTSALGREPDRQPHHEGHSSARDSSDHARELPLRVAAAAAAGKLSEASALVASAPLEQRLALANRLVAHAPASRLPALATDASLEVVVAAADRIEQTLGAAAALDTRARASALAPDDADLLDGLARALAATGRIDNALVAWDRAAAVAPAQPTFRLAPIRALVASMASADPTAVSEPRTGASAEPTAVSAARTGASADPTAVSDPRAGSRAAQVRARVARLVDEARAQAEPEPYVTAAHAAVAAGDPAHAVAVLREARTKHPTHGRLAFELALRLVDANDRDAAIEAFAELLVCGAHGRPWHRHEIAGKLVAIATDPPARQLARDALDRERACTLAAPDDLATYTSQLRAQLAK